jgi:hypothetical protein
VSRMRCSAGVSAAVHRWSGTAKSAMPAFVLVKVGCL